MSSYTADRQGHIYKNDSGQDCFLEKMYGCAFGRALLKPLVNPVLSELGGEFLIPAFQLWQFRHLSVMPESTCGIMRRKFWSYNDFFTKEGSVKARDRSVWFRNIL